MRPSKTSAATIATESNPATAQTAVRMCRVTVRPGSPGPAAGVPRHVAVLVADDNADLRDYMRRLLEADGYEVRTATDGAR